MAVILYDVSHVVVITENTVIGVQVIRIYPFAALIACVALGNPEDFPYRRVWIFILYLSNTLMMADEIQAVVNPVSFISEIVGR